VSDLTSRAFGLGLSDLFGVGLARCPCSSLIISLFVRYPGRRPVRSNNCSLTHAAASWVFEHLEQLFVPNGPATDWVSDSDFTIVRYSGPVPGYLNTTGDNNVSVGYYAVTTVTTKNEPLFAHISVCCQVIISYDINYIKG